jgi:hypothetical protein
VEQVVPIPGNHNMEICPLSVRKRVIIFVGRISGNGESRHQNTAKRKSVANIG